MSLHDCYMFQCGIRRSSWMIGRYTKIKSTSTNILWADTDENVFEYACPCINKDFQDASQFSCWRADQEATGALARSRSQVLIWYNYSRLALEHLSQIGSWRSGSLLRGCQIIDIDVICQQHFCTKISKTSRHIHVNGQDRSDLNLGKNSHQ